MRSNKIKIRNSSSYHNEALLEPPKDRRLLIKKQTIDRYPYNCIGLLQTSIQGKQMVIEGNATGFLVNRYIVVTSAHVLFGYIQKLGEFWEIAPEFFSLDPLDTESSQVKGIKISDYKIPAEYIDAVKKMHLAKNKEQKRSWFRVSEQYDFAILKLSEEVRREKYFKLYPDFSKKKEVFVCGYCKVVKETGSYFNCYVHSGDLIFKQYPQGKRGRYNIDTMNGQSGSPVYCIKKEEQKIEHCYAVAIHKSFDTKLNLNTCTLITGQVIDYMNKWMKEMKMTIEIRQKASIRQKNETNSPTAEEIRLKMSNNQILEQLKQKQKQLDRIRNQFLSVEDMKETIKKHAQKIQQLQYQLRHEREASSYMVDQILSDLHRYKSSKNSLRIDKNVIRTEIKPTPSYHEYDDQFSDIPELLTPEQQTPDKKISEVKFKRHNRLNSQLIKSQLMSQPANPEEKSKPDPSSYNQEPKKDNFLLHPEKQRQDLYRSSEFSKNNDQFNKTGDTYAETLPPSISKIKNQTTQFTELPVNKNVIEGHNHFKCQRFGQAIQSYQKAIKEDPNIQDISVYNFLGKALSKKGKVKEAISYYRLAKKLDQQAFYSVVDFQKDYGVALQEDRRYDEAIQWWLEILIRSQYARHAYFPLERLVCRKSNNVQLLKRAVNVIERNMNRLPPQEECHNLAKRSYLILNWKLDTQRR